MEKFEVLLSAAQWQAQQGGPVRILSEKACRQPHREALEGRTRVVPAPEIAFPARAAVAENAKLLSEVASNQPQTRKR